VIPETMRDEGGSMRAYVDIGGHSTWVVDGGGSGDPVLLLHGGLSNSDLLLDAIGPSLAEHHRVIAFDRRGHGRTPDTDAAFHYADMATEAVRVIEEVIRGPAHLVGWSDGGIVALLVALERPEVVRKVVVVGANYHHSGLLPVEPDPDSTFLHSLTEAYTERSPDGPEHLGIVYAKALAMLRSEPTLTTSDIALIKQPTLVVAGDDDAIALSHTCSLYEALPQGQLAVLAGASHALPVEQPEVLGRLTAEFLVGDPPVTLLPVRRAQPHRR
jgi:pimeloyl-ACP methyl ester carboxylesterase